MQALTPTLNVTGKEHPMMQLAGISVRELGAIVDPVPQERAKVAGALDLLVTGI